MHRIKCDKLATNEELTKARARANGLEDEEANGEGRRTGECKRMNKQARGEARRRTARDKELVANEELAMVTANGLADEAANGEGQRTDECMRMSRPGERRKGERQRISDETKNGQADEEANGEGQRSGRRAQRAFDARLNEWFTVHGIGSCFLSRTCIDGPPFVLKHVIKHAKPTTRLLFSYRSRCNEGGKGGKREG